MSIKEITVDFITYDLTNYYWKDLSRLPSEPALKIIGTKFSKVDRLQNKGNKNYFFRLDNKRYIEIQAKNDDEAVVKLSRFLDYIFPATSIFDSNMSEIS